MLYTAAASSSYKKRDGSFLLTLVGLFPFPFLLLRIPAVPVPWYTSSSSIPHEVAPKLFLLISSLFFFVVLLLLLLHHFGFLHLRAILDF